MVVDNSWQTAMHLLEDFISRLMDDGTIQRRVGGGVVGYHAQHPFLIFISAIRKPNFFFLTPLHLSVYATVSFLFWFIGALLEKQHFSDTSRL